MITYTMKPNDEVYEFITKIYMQESKAFHIRKRKLGIVCFLSLVIMGMSIAGMVGSNGYDNGWLAFLVVGAGAFLAGSYQLLFGVHRQTLRTLKQAEANLGGFTERTYTFGDDITIHSEKADTRLNWEAIERWGEEENYIYLQYGGSFILIDKDEMSPEDVEELKAYIILFAFDKQL